MTVLGKISDGDFTQRSNVQTKDEFGEFIELGQWLVAKHKGDVWNRPSL